MKKRPEVDTVLCDARYILRQADTQVKTRPEVDNVLYDARDIGT